MRNEKRESRRRGEERERRRGKDDEGKTTRERRRGKDDEGDDYVRRWYLGRFIIVTSGCLLLLLVQ
jgi:hypothetical protein